MTGRRRDRLAADVEDRAAPHVAHHVATPIDAAKIGIERHLDPRSAVADGVDVADDVRGEVRLRVRTNPRRFEGDSRQLTAPPRLEQPRDAVAVAQRLHRFALAGAHCFGGDRLVSGFVERGAQILDRVSESFFDARGGAVADRGDGLVLARFVSSPIRVGPNPQRGDRFGQRIVVAHQDRTARREDLLLGDVCIDRALGVILVLANLQEEEPRLDRDEREEEHARHVRESTACGVHGLLAPPGAARRIQCSDPIGAQIRLHRGMNRVGCQAETRDVVLRLLHLEESAAAIALGTDALRERIGFGEVGGDPIAALPRGNVGLHRPDRETRERDHRKTRQFVTHVRLLIQRPTARRSSARSFELRERGLRASSDAVGSIGRAVRTRPMPCSADA
jgi:hypothetical protein